MKRVSIEPNFHVLYMNFLDALNEKQMFTSVLKETHRNIKVSIHIHAANLFEAIVGDSL